MDPRIEHLSTEELDELMMEYYSGEKPSNLIKRYKIKVPPSRLYTLFPKLKLKETCPYCNVPFEQKMPSFSSKSDEPAFCPICSHIKDDNTCLCKNCLKKSEEYESKRINEIKTQLKEILLLRSRKEISSITTEGRLYLATLIRACLEKNRDRILPYIDSNIPITSNSDWDVELVTYLFDQNYINVHPSSTIEAFIMDDNNKIQSFILDQVHYLINIEQGGLNREEFIDLLSTPKEILNDTAYCYYIWHRIVEEDCLAYLYLNLESVYFPLPSREKAIPVIDEMLEYFSPSQIYSIIYRQISNGTRYYQENDITPQHATNIVLSSCKSFTNKAVSEKWNVYEYKRIVEIPESALIRVFFYRILELREQWFYTPISYEYLSTMQEQFLKEVNDTQTNNTEPKQTT